MKHIIATVAIALSATVGVNAQRILMTGDSHVNGKIYPETVGKIIRSASPEAEFSHYGIVGAGFYTFNKDANMQKLLSYRPEILIVHLGTNDSYSPKFNPETITSTMQTFYDKVKAALPDVKMVFVTPFDNKRKDSKGVYQLNDGARQCAVKMEEFVSAHPGTYIIDNNRDHGMDFIDRELIRKDFVHLTAKGYEVLGTQVGEELLTLPGLFDSADPLPIDPEK